MKKVEIIDNNGQVLHEGDIIIYINGYSWTTFIEFDFVKRTDEGYLVGELGGFPLGQKAVRVEDVRVIDISHLSKCKQWALKQIVRYCGGRTTKSKTDVISLFKNFGFDLTHYLKNL